MQSADKPAAAGEGNDSQATEEHGPRAGLGDGNQFQDYVVAGADAVAIGVGGVEDVECKAVGGRER